MFFQWGFGVDFGYRIYLPAKGTVTRVRSGIVGTTFPEKKAGDENPG